MHSALVNAAISRLPTETGVPKTLIAALDDGDGYSRIGSSREKVLETFEDATTVVAGGLIWSQRTDVIAGEMVSTWKVFCPLLLQAEYYGRWAEFSDAAHEYLRPHLPMEAEMLPVDAFALVGYWAHEEDTTSVITWTLSTFRRQLLTGLAATLQAMLKKPQTYS
jgi:hypothetical protein